MKTRVITGIVAAVLFLPFLIFSGTPAYLFFSVAAVLVSIFEMCGCMRQRQHLPIFLLSEVYGIACILLTRLSTAFPARFVGCTAAYALLIMIFALFSKGEFRLDQAAMLIFGIVYLTFGYASIILIRDLPEGAYIFWLIFIAAWLSDTGAYFVGVKFGKHKLIPEISPKKTVEGLFGGIASCTLIFMIYCLIIALATEKSVNPLAFFVLGILLSFVSVIGDLLASFIKRHFKVKDYGALLPGHGGLMDRFDSVLAVAVVLYIFCANATFMPLFR